MTLREEDASEPAPETAVPTPTEAAVRKADGRLPGKQSAAALLLLVLGMAGYFRFTGLTWGEDSYTPTNFS